jgi:hypothetical protein
MVGGTSGEYSDRTEWVVDAWRSEIEAQARVTELKRFMQEIGIDWHKWEDRERAIKKMRKHDAAFQLDYTGTEYYICELELKP